MYREGRRRTSREFAVFLRANGLDESRFGWSIKKALGSAVKRNRIRRRIREIVRLHRQEISPGWDIVIHPRTSVATAEFAGLTEELLKLLPRRAAETGGGHGLGSQQRLSASVRAAGKWALLLFVRFYQIFLSPFFGGACKFYPSCSKYGYEAIARHGAWRGSLLAMKRLLRCRPFTKGGFDPVPDEIAEAKRTREFAQ